MKFYQVCGICKKQKFFLGLSWKTYESFYDSQLLGEESAKIRLSDLERLKKQLDTKADCEGQLKQYDISGNIVKLGFLRIYEIEDGSYIGNGRRIKIESDDIYKYSF